MKNLRCVAYWLPFIFICSLAATRPMSPDSLEQYIQKKLRRNNQSLKLNEKLIGDEGALRLEQSPLFLPAP